MELNIDVQAEYDRLRVFYEETEPLLDAPDDVLATTHEAVSDWSPAQHLYHIWLANARSLKAAALMAQGQLSLEDGGSPNAVGRQVLTEERFVRGQVEAPDDVRPPVSVVRKELAEIFQRSRAKLDELAPHLAALARVTKRLEHPRLGLLNGPEWLRFVRIHSEHHHALIRDILETEPPLE